MLLGFFLKLRMNQTKHHKKEKKVGCSRQTNLSCESVRVSAASATCPAHTCHFAKLLPHMVWKIKGCVSNSTFSCKFEGMLHVRVPAGSGPSVLTFLSPEKNNFVRSYRSCLARDRREGRGERRVGLL